MNLDPVYFYAAGAVITAVSLYSVTMMWLVKRPDAESIKTPKDDLAQRVAKLETRLTDKSLQTHEPAHSSIKRLIESVDDPDELLGIAFKIVKRLAQEHDRSYKHENKHIAHSVIKVIDDSNDVLDVALEAIDKLYAKTELSKALSGMSTLELSQFKTLLEKTNYRLQAIAEEAEPYFVSKDKKSGEKQTSDDNHSVA